MLQQAIEKELDQIREGRLASMACACVPPDRLPLHSSINVLLKEAVARKILPELDDAGVKLNKERLLSCLYVNDEPLLSKSKLQQRQVLYELLHSDDVKLCGPDSGCACASGELSLLLFSSC